MIKQLSGILVVIFTTIFVDIAYSQTLDEAKELYKKGEYEKAMPAFEKAAKATPNNSSYNQWYGNCLLETGKIAESEKYLKYAASRNIKESFRSLGKLYMLQYKFPEAQKAYEDYLAFLKKEKNQEDMPAIEVLINQAKTAFRLLSHCEDIQIADSIVVNKIDFLNYYTILSKESGAIYELNKAACYENQLKSKRYYSKQGEDGNYHIYSQSNLIDGWSDEFKLNLVFEELDSYNYPFVLSDGITLYFAATGEQSIGGYDLFITRYNSGNESYLKPEQLGMPFNSPYNDYMLAIDEYYGVGYFATDRFQPEGKVVIYTYLLNNEKRTLETDSEEYRIQRAKIGSIKDSQKEGVNYSDIQKQIKAEQQKAIKKESREFEFVINDNIIYYNLADFESDAAKQYFTQYQNLQKQLRTLGEKLDSNRIKYSKSNATQKKTMETSILSDEKRMEDLVLQIDEIAVKARNTEINHIKNNQ